MPNVKYEDLPDEHKTQYERDKEKEKEEEGK